VKNLIVRLFPVLDILCLPFVVVAAYILKGYRTVDSHFLPKNTSVLKSIGVYPIRDHYYEPLFNDNLLRENLNEKRTLPGIDLRLEHQLTLLNQLRYQEDFEKFLAKQKLLTAETGFSLKNGSFESGDAEFLFNFIRHTKPKRIIEIGCGSSTKVISAALAFNASETDAYALHTCIEPYEQPWLDSFPNVKLIRDIVENISLDTFENLGADDLLFIDSSHIIRPQGDVLREYLDIIPSLNSGVYVHVHDIFTPRDYREEWIRKKVRFWNEQYLLEGILSNNPSYETVAALNYLKHENFEAIKNVCPSLSEEKEPGSFYFKIT